MNEASYALVLLLGRLFSTLRRGAGPRAAAPRVAGTKEHAHAERVTD